MSALATGATSVAAQSEAAASTANTAPADEARKDDPSAKSMSKFVFGDFNFRLDLRGVVRHVCGARGLVRLPMVMSRAMSRAMSMPMRAGP